jgi:hypothetical protein
MADTLITGTTLIEDKRREFGGVWSCTGLHFRATDGGLNSMDNGSAYVSSTGDFLAAAVFLPHGAKITGVVVYGVDEDAVGWELHRKITNAGSQELMATAAINIEDKSILNETVDNSTYSYFLISAAALNSGGDRFTGARITYI